VVLVVVGVVVVVMMMIKSVAFSPQVNCTDWVTATGQQILVPAFADRGVSRGHHGGTPMAANLSFLDWSCYFSFD
jgi:hypothetical protein